MEKTERVSGHKRWRPGNFLNSGPDIFSGVCTKRGLFSLSLSLESHRRNSPTASGSHSLVEHKAKRMNSVESSSY